VRVDVHALAPVTSHHDNFGSEASTFDVKLEAIALRIAHGSAAGAAAAFSPAPTDLILVIDRELTDEIEIVAVTRTAKLKIDFALRTPFPDQLPAKSAKGPACADAGGTDKTETTARRQKPRMPARENADRKSDVRCKGVFPSSSC
jgi:hypothetical protein